MKKGDKILVTINGMELPAVLIEYRQIETNELEDTYTKEYIFYCQNRIARQSNIFVKHPNNLTTDGFVHCTTDILVEYCIIPEFDSILED